MPRHRQGLEWPRLLFSLAIPQIAGGIGALATRESVRTWYPTLRKPAFTPPGSLFGPVWTLLYLLMGLAEYLVLRKRAERQVIRADIQSAQGWYFTQLGFNTLWSILFFGLRRPFAALVELTVLLGAIVATIVSFSRISRLAGLLLLPYLLWTSFAAVLNASIWWKNRTRT